MRRGAVRGVKSPEEGGVGQGEGLGGESWERGWARRGDFRGEWGGFQEGEGVEAPASPEVT